MKTRASATIAKGGSGTPAPRDRTGVGSLFVISANVGIV